VGVFVAGSALAGASCCPSKAKKDATVAQKKECKENLMSELNLTDEQKTQIDALKAECDKTECSEAACKKYTEEMHKILTEEQVEKCQALCKENGWKCPIGGSTN
jgi:Spy/CpxP family protein refolding chaperone